MKSWGEAQVSSALSPVPFPDVADKFLTLRKINSACARVREKGECCISPDLNSDRWRPPSGNPALACSPGVGDSGRLRSSFGTAGGGGCASGWGWEKPGPSAGKRERWRERACARVFPTAGSSQEKA